MYPSKPSVKLLMDSKDPGPEKKRFNLNLLFPAGKLKIAFIHNKSPETSSWTYGHELGRAYLEDSLKEKVETKAWFHVDSPKAEQKAFEEAISWGCSVIFSTSPPLLSSSIKYAMKYPKLCVLNCSLNTGDDHIKTYYGRLYEAKFLMGAVAGIMSKSDKIGYIADYPIFGMIANINVFALGVRMIRPEAKIYLEWSTLKHNNVEKIRKDFAISFISDRDFMIPNKDSNRFGLYQTDGKQPVNLIMPTRNWGVFYETIAKSILDGTWKQPGNGNGKTSLNYWWGMSSDMIDVIYSSKLPSGTRQLINLLRKSIQIGDFNPFSGTIYSQDGLVHNNPDAITPKEIVTMDWLCDNIIGSIPTMDEISDEAKSIVELQGVSKAKQTTKESL